MTVCLSRCYHETGVCDNAVFHVLDSMREGDAGPAGWWQRRRGAEMDGSVWRAITLASSFGVMAALLVAGGVLGGRWLDARMHTAPLFAVVGLFLGLALGGVSFLRQVSRIQGGPER